MREKKKSLFLAFFVFLFPRFSVFLASQRQIFSLAPLSNCFLFSQDSGERKMGFSPAVRERKIDKKVKKNRFFRMSFSFSLQ